MQFIILLLITNLMFSCGNRSLEFKNKPFLCFGNKPLTAEKQKKYNDNLISAARNGYIKPAIKLLNKGSDVNCVDLNGWTPLICAASNGQIKIIRKLLDKGANTNIRDNNGNTALIHAVKNQNFEIVTQLLAAGADINISNNNGGTALMNAVEKDYVEIVAQLLAAGADINVRDNNGNTILINAATWGLNSIVAQLLAAGADINVRDNNGNTILINAVKNQNVEIATQLLTAGADINVRDNNGNTALMQAVINESIECIEILLDKGADPNSTNNENISPLMLAINKRLSNAIIIPLINYGAYLNEALINDITLFIKLSDLDSANTILLLKSTLRAMSNKIDEIYNSANIDEVNLFCNLVNQKFSIRNNNTFKILEDFCHERAQNITNGRLTLLKLLIEINSKLKHNKYLINKPQFRKVLQIIILPLLKYSEGKLENNLKALSIILWIFQDKMSEDCDMVVPILISGEAGLGLKGLGWPVDEFFRHKSRKNP